jgi:hypothetical protein
MSGNLRSADDLYDPVPPCECLLECFCFFYCIVRFGEVCKAV